MVDVEVAAAVARGRMALDAHRARILDVVGRDGVLLRLDAPVQLSGGDWSDVFVDGKLAVDEPECLEAVATAMVAAARAGSADVEAVGGLVLGAAPFAFGVALVGRVRW